MLALAVCVLSAVASAQTRDAKAEQLVRDYLAARIQTMQAGATMADVDRVLALCTDDVSYQHGKAKIDGKETMRKGMSAYFGATKDAKVKIRRMLSNANVVAAEVEMTFLGQQDDGSWKPGGRKNITVFEIAGGQIKRILDY